MAKRKPITVRNWCVFDDLDEPILYDDLPPGKQKQVSQYLADKFMAAMGYERVPDNEKTAAD